MFQLVTRLLSARRLAALLVVSGLLAIAGCSSEPPRFEPNALAMVEAQLVPSHRADVEAAMAELFGTPDEPKVPEGLPLDLERLRMASGPAGYEEQGDGDEHLQRGLYRQHCASCHGTTGDGMGPAASMLEPYPRDFRPGVFKWKSTYLAARPTDSDLDRTLERGVPGTAMPSFRLLDEEQRSALVEYVKYLSIRGEVEQQLVSLVADELDADLGKQTTDDPFDPLADEDDADLVAEAVDEVARRWHDTPSRVVQPTAQPSDRRSAEAIAQSVAAGRGLFLSDRAKCTECHGQPGQGAILKELDDWNRAVFLFHRDTASLAAAIERQADRLKSLPAPQHAQLERQLAADRRQLAERERLAASLLEPQPARPRSLEQGVFRGGDEPLDVYRRIHQGVAGTPMPGQGPPRPGVDGALSEAEIWQLVDYVRSLRRSGDL